MTYLQLCQFVQRFLAAGNDLPSNPMTTTISQTGYLYEIVQWVQDAYRNIQNEQSQWLFRTSQGILTISCDVDASTMSIGAIKGGGITDYDQQLFFTTPEKNRYLRIYDSSQSITTASYCYYIPYQRWRGWRDQGTIPTGKPSMFTVLPNRSLQFSPAPSDASYNLLMDYCKTIDVLASDGQVPIMPDDYHEAIAWYAVIYWSTVRQSEARYGLAKKEYERIMNAMRRTQLPEQLIDETTLYGD